jgi:predicted small lipoprotein YifL
LKFPKSNKKMNFMDSVFRKIRTVSSLGFTILIITIVLLVSGCGKKGPPVPPRYEIPPPVSDLSWEINEQTLTLSWSVPQAASPIRLTGFKVYRSQKRLSLLDCPDCPEMFKPVADILIKTPVKEDQVPERKTYTEAIEDGFRYEYKVVGYTENGVSSPDSNIVGFDYPIRMEKAPSEVRP